MRGWMVLRINHLEVIKIWGYYTPIQSVTKKPIILHALLEFGCFAKDDANG
jgi:hypothetical protein